VGISALPSLSFYAEAYRGWLSPLSVPFEKGKGGRDRFGAMQIMNNLER